MLFHDRRDAGRRLVRPVAEAVDEPERALVLALPRGGVPVAAEVAAGLGADLDVLVVRKLGLPAQEELAMGAIARGVMTLNDEVLRSYQVDPSVVERVAERERLELERREQLYRDGRPPQPVEGREVVVVDDGLATGASMRVALEALGGLRPLRLLVAVPVAAAEVVERLRSRADEVVCLATPSPFSAVGHWYEDFDQVSDAEVRRLLAGYGDAAGLC